MDVVCIHVHERVWRPETDVVTPLLLLSASRQGSSWPGCSLFQISRLLNKSGRLFPPLTARVADACSHLWCFTWVVDTDSGPGIYTASILLQ